MNYREISLLIAESIDAWRVIPRVILVLYSTLVFKLYVWYKSIPTYIQESCDSSTLRVLLEANMNLDDAKQIACTVVDIVGGPTAAQSAFVTTIIGLSTGIFGLYVATGRKWDKNGADNSNPFPPPGTNINTSNSYTPHNYDTPPRQPPYDNRENSSSPSGPWGNRNS